MSTSFAFVASTKSVAGKCQELGRGIQIRLGAQKIDVSKIGRKPWKALMEIDTLPVPPREPVNCKSVPEVVRTRTVAPSRWFETSGAIQLAERDPCSRWREGPTIISDEQPIVG
jgi:hypothetical protein